MFTDSIKTKQDILKIITEFMFCDDISFTIDDIPFKVSTDILHNMDFGFLLLAAQHVCLLVINFSLGLYFSTGCMCLLPRAQLCNNGLSQKCL